ncbi:MAG: hypothetical protein ACFCUQ_17475 [Kiloniellales bacterium]
MKPIECEICCNESESVLYRSLLAFIAIPSKQHVSPADGGHLIVCPIRHVRDRSGLNASELMEVSWLTIFASRLLRDILEVNWFNYQENGNWLLRHPEIQHMHIHVYGRSETAKFQKYGESLHFPPSEHLDKWHVEQYSIAQVESLRQSAYKYSRSDEVQQFQTITRKIQKLAI